MAAIDSSHVKTLQSLIRGQACAPGSDGFDEACRIWNGSITRRPSVVARCTEPEDVVAALHFAQTNGLEVSVRGGGHGFAGFALCNGGLMIDLSPMKSIRLEVANRRATCAGGVTWGELDAATQANGLAVPGGQISHTGVAGLTLGGGFGWLTRKAGLSCDNLLSAEVVTAGGRVLRASADENADLFWAIRGGGGNFGVVTSFEFRTIEIGPIVQVALFFYGLDQAAAMLRLIRDHLETLPDDFGLFVGGLNAPPAPFVPEQHRLKPCFALGVVGFGGEAALTEAIGVVRDAPHLFEMVTPMPYVAVQQMFDESAPWGILAYEKAVYLDELSDAAIDVITAHVPRRTSPMSIMPSFALGGAFARVPEDATAFGGRRTIRYVVNMAAIAPTLELLDADRAWSRAFWTDLVEHSTGPGGYVNFMSEDDEQRVRAAYGPEKYDRLSAIKAEYDPDNVFHLNANIKPAR
jgi:hypothetical protein